MISVAIMQPTYLPWLGYFAMMAEADVFVFLDSVQFEKRSWQQRNRIKGPQGEHMLTVPVLSKGSFDQRIDAAAIDATSDFRRRHVASMRHFYGRSPAFAEASALLFPLMEYPTNLLADYTIHITAAIAAALGIAPRIVRSSALAATGAKADLLVSICRAIGATRYISAPGSAGYIEQSDVFDRAGIAIAYNTFRSVPYAQPHGAFVSHLSVADALFSEGIATTRGLIQSGRHLTPAEAFHLDRSVA